MQILVLSCDKYIDLAYPFHYCMEKYWPNHPKITYMMDTIKNPYYDTVLVDYPISQWTRRVRETLDTINDNNILLMMDDCFIRRSVDETRLEYINSCLTENSNIACFNLEKSFDFNDTYCEFEGFKKRQHGSSYEVSIMCGLWNKNKLRNVLSIDSNPWEVEFRQNNCGYDYYINNSDYIIDWGYQTWNPTNVFKGRWCKNALLFFEKEGVKIDLSARGIWE